MSQVLVSINTKLKLIKKDCNKALFQIIALLAYLITIPILSLIVISMAKSLLIGFGDDFSLTMITVITIAISIISLLFVVNISLKIKFVYNNYAKLMDDYGKLFLVLHLKEQEIYRPKLTK